MSESKYFNFPIQLLEGFLIDSDDCLSDIAAFGVYSFSKHLEYKEEGQGEHEDFESSANALGIRFSNSKNSYKLGKKLFDSYSSGSPKVGISLAIYWDYHNNYKTEYQKVCLLAYLALKSIAQNKPFCKVTNLYWFARMAGFQTSINDKDELPPELLKYTTEYQLKKIKNDLVLDWHLTTFSRYTRGFYVSFQMDLESLIEQAELRRKDQKIKEYKRQEKLILQKVLMKLNK